MVDYCFKIKPGGVVKLMDYFCIDSLLGYNNPLPTFVVDNTDDVTGGIRYVDDDKKSRYEFYIYFGSRVVFNTVGSDLAENIVKRLNIMPDSNKGINRRLFVGCSGNGSDV